jgi:hypothetical protein
VASISHTASTNEGLFWHASNVDFFIGRTSGAWSSPNYAQLKLDWDTGIELDGGTLYGKSGVNISGGNFKVAGTTVVDASRNATFVKQTINATIAPNAFAWLNIGSTGSAETRAIDIDGAWSANESKCISFTHGSLLYELVGQIKSTYLAPNSSLSFGRLYHSGNSSVYPMVLTSTSTTTADLSVLGNITASANVTAYSDERLKSDIQTLDGKKVLQMRGVSFTKEGKEGSGVIAQELEKIAPELVQDGEYKSVAYGNITGYLIEAIKEQQKEIDELKLLVKQLLEK